MIWPRFDRDLFEIWPKFEQALNDGNGPPSPLLVCRATIDLTICIKLDHSKRIWPQNLNGSCNQTDQYVHSDNFEHSYWLYRAMYLLIDLITKIDSTSWFILTALIDLTIWIGLTIPSGRFDLIGWIDFTWKFTIRIGLVIPIDYLSKRIDLTSRITLDIRVQARITLNIRIQVVCTWQCTECTFWSI